MDRRSAQITACSFVRQLGPAVRYVLRGGPAVMTAAGQTLGLEISLVPCRAATRLRAASNMGNLREPSNPSAEGVGSTGAQSDALPLNALAALWLGPDEQLLLANDGVDLAATLAPALRGLPHSLVDVSHRQTAIEVSGAQASVLLNTGCPLDLHLSSFPIGMCTRTVLAKAEIVLWRTHEQAFHVEVWRSFAAYVTGFLAEAAREIAL